MQHQNAFIYFLSFGWFFPAFSLLLLHFARLFYQQLKYTVSFWWQLFKMEDVSMGMWVEQFNSTMTVRYSHSWKFCQYGCMEGYYTAHYQSPRQMICLWDKLSRGRAHCCNFRWQAAFVANYCYNLSSYSPACFCEIFFCPMKWG